MGETVGVTQDEDRPCPRRELRQPRAHTCCRLVVERGVEWRGISRSDLHLEDVTIVAWQQNCITCHGQLGRGDGPRGPMVKATNLSDPAWQAAITDEQIARTIKEGKGAMPPFKLPDGTIANLVKLVRMMNAARLGAHGGAAAPSASASASAAPASPAASGGAKPTPGHRPPA